MKLKHNTVFLIASRVTVDSSQTDITDSLFSHNSMTGSRRARCLVSLPCTTLLRSKGQCMLLLPPEQEKLQASRGELAVGQA